MNAKTCSDCKHLRYYRNESTHGCSLAYFFEAEEWEFENYAGDCPDHDPENFPFMSPGGSPDLDRVLGYLGPFVFQKPLKPREPDPETGDICPKCGKPTGVTGTCPYDSEIYEEDTICGCCPSCRHDCWMDT